MARVGVKVNKYGTTPEQFNRMVRNKMAEFQTSSRSAAMKVRNSMVGYIQEKVESNNVTGNRVSTGALVGSIKVHKVANGWAVGSISEMNKRAPYWKVVNYGHHGYMIPEITPRNGKALSFIGAKDGDRVVTQKVKARKQVIHPMNYIEFGLMIAKDFFRDDFKKIGRKKPTA